MSDRLAMLALERASVQRPMARLVLVAIALHARNSVTPTWPSLSRLAAITGLTRRAVYRVIPDLEAAGDLTVLRDGTRANRYLVHPGRARDRESLAAGDRASLELGTRLGTHTHQLGTETPPTRDTRSPELEELEELEGGIARARAKNAAPPPLPPRMKLGNLYEAYADLTGKECDQKAHGWIDDLVRQVGGREAVGRAMYADPHPRRGNLLGRVKHVLHGGAAS